MIAIDEKGYYGEFGGAYVPEMLHSNVLELQQKYVEIISSEVFQKDFHQMLVDYVGRPTPLTYALRLSEKFNTIRSITLWGRYYLQKL